MIKTFKGLLADGGQDHIRLSTIKGKVGYRIIKFQVMPPQASVNVEATLQIWKTFQTSIVNTVNFTDSDLLAAAIINEDTSSELLPAPVIIFDNEIFNQDIYITQKGADYTADVNYYLELEVIPLDDAGAEYTTLRDIRQKGTP